MAVRPPVLGTATPDYDMGAMSRFISELKAYFERSNQPHAVNASTLNINIKTLPTEASYAALVSGDVYRDTTAVIGTTAGHVLKIKP